MFRRVEVTNLDVIFGEEKGERRAVVLVRMHGALFRMTRHASDRSLYQYRVVRGEPYR